jgi:GH43 family beta-xylosidase
MNGNYWAPEIHKVGGNFILTGTSLDSRTGRMTIAMASSATINGAYTVRSEPIVSDSRHVLDSNIFIDDDGTPYLLWKRDGPSGGQFGSIRIRKLDATGLNFAAGSTETVILDNETAGWERNLAEAPWLVRRADAYYLFYSAAFIDTTYSVGVARGTSLTTMFARNPANPILKNNAIWGGPGHGGFTLDLDGTLYHQYHARLMSDPDAGRKQLLDPVVWTSSGWPSFGNGGTPSSINQGPRVAAPMASTAYSFAGDVNGTVTNDTFRVVRSAINSSMLEIYLNGALQKSTPFSEVLSLTIDGKAGDDTLELDASLGEVIAGGGITFIGGNGAADRIRWIGQSAVSSLRVIQGGKLAQGSGLIVPSGVEQIETLGGTLRLQADLSFVSPAFITLSAVGTSISVDAIQHVASMSLSEAASAVLNVSALVTGSLFMDETSTLDLGANALIVTYAVGASPVLAIETLVRNARGVDAAWTQPGITSSLARVDASGRTVVGAAESTEVFASFPAFFAGQSIDETSVIVRATIAGDLDLDLSVGFSDLLRLAQNYGQTARRYAEGNADYSQDGTVSFDDLLLLAQTYGQALLRATPLTTSSINPAKKRPRVDMGVIS